MRRKFSMKYTLITLIMERDTGADSQEKSFFLRFLLTYNVICFILYAVYDIISKIIS